MEVKDFSFDFEYRGSTLTATCQEFQVGEYPQIRVWVNCNRWGKVFIYYRYPKRQIFYYPLVDKWKAMGAIIAQKLKDRY